MSELWGHIVHDFAGLFAGDASAWFAFGQVILIDIVLAGDNAIVIGALAAGLPADQRKKVILIGIIAALVLRIGFALVVTQLMAVIGLVFAGGVLLLWVAWKMYREIVAGGHSPGSPEIEGDEHSGLKPAKSFAGAAWAVAVADVSMGIAANIIAKYIERYRWIAWVGLLVILYVAGSMIYSGIIDKDIGILQLFQ